MHIVNKAGGSNDNYTVE